MTLKTIHLIPSSANYLLETLEKRKKQITKNMLKINKDEWYDLEENQVHYKLCETHEEYNEIDRILSEILS